MNTEQGDRLPSRVLAQVAQRGRMFLALLRATWKEYQHDHAGFFAGSIVYSALLSLIPLVLLFLSALGLLLRFSELAAQWQQQVLSAIDARFGEEVGATIEQLLVTFEQQSVIATIIGLITLLLTASGLFRQLRLSFRAIWKHAPPLVSGSVWVVMLTSLREQIISFVMVFTVGGLLLVSLMLISVTRWLHVLTSDMPLFYGADGWLLTTLGSLAMAAVTFGLLFKYLPPVPLRWRDVWVATLLCTAAWRIASELLALYGDFFTSNLSAYGAIGGVLVVMLWMNLVSQMLFFGAELCKVTVTQAGSFTVDHTP